MRNPMNKRYLRELKGDFGKYAVIFLFIVMVVSVVSSFLVANAGVAKAYHDALAQNNVENGHFILNVVPEDDFIKDIEEAANITLYRADYFEEENDNVTMRVYRLGSGINEPTVTEGELPKNEGEIAIDNVHSIKAGINIGDTIRVDGHNVKVTGFVALPNYSALFKDNSDFMFDNENFGLGVMSERGFDAFSSDHITVNYGWTYNEKPSTDKESKEASEDVIEALRDELIKVNTDIVARSMMGEKNLTMLELSDYIPDYENKAINFPGEDMEGDGGAMSAFLVIVVVVLAFIVAVTTLNTISKEAAVIGTLRASGYTKGELVRHYFMLPFLSFLAGMVVGNVIGYTVMRDMMLKIYKEMYSLGNAETLWNKEAFIKTTLIPSIIMIVINVAVLVWKMRIKPLTFLRRETSGRGKKRAMRLPKVLPFTHRFRIRIIFQNLSNYITMAIGVILAGAIIIFGLMIKPLLDNLVDRIQDTSISKYQYVLKTPEDAGDDSAEKYAIATLETTRGDFKTDEISVFGIDKDSRYIKEAIPEGKALASNGYMDKYELKVGDKVDLYDKYADKTYTFEIAGDYPYEASLAVFMNLSEFNETYDKTPDYYSGYFSDKELENLTESNIYVKIDSSTLGGLAKQLWKSFAGIMTPVQWFGVAMFVLMVYLLSKQIIEKNANSISMTKILGFTGGEIGGLYIVSTSIVVVLSLIVSVPFVDEIVRLIFKYYLYKRMSGYLPCAVDNACYIKMIVLGIVSYLAVVVMQLIKIRGIKKSDALKTLE